MAGSNSSARAQLFKSLESRERRRRLTGAVSQSTRPATPTSAWGGNSISAPVWGPRPRPLPGPARARSRCFRPWREWTDLELSSFQAHVSSLSPPNPCTLGFPSHTPGGAHPGEARSQRGNSWQSLARSQRRPHPSPRPRPLTAAGRRATPRAPPVTPRGSLSEAARDWGLRPP